jgi:23S rRNA (guanosine2251-2'-O)-methyltransferase
LSRSRRPDPPKQRDRYLVPGERAVTELLHAAPERVRELWIERGRDMPALVELAQSVGVAIRPRERDELEDAVGPGLARGVVAHARPPVAWAIEDLLDREDGPRTRRGFRLLVVLDGVQDPHNLGAVIRSAEFFGAAGVVWARDRAAPLGPAAIRSSAGATERLPLCQVTNLARALEQAKQAQWWVIGTVVEDDEDEEEEGGASRRTPVQPVRELAEDPPSDMVLVLGSEEKGLRRLTRERCDFLVTIEGAGSLGSLNVSAAAAVTLAWLG